MDDGSRVLNLIPERYPLTSQLIQENKIPEFDNLYLDFNGIIHNCSHPNDEDAHFRLSEEQIFTAIFSYVDHLFGKIKPKKLFFMAVDGVAPRAKMNQQRGRRFRSAKEAQEVREKAERKGEKLPDEKAFDSNCITPGTPFMARLSDQLRYFINKKITEDSNWRNVQVVLSGHEVPGEGEHKIMEYIRLSRAQPDYNPNVRHCLYGLDADLIMLGLLSHDPHFCLLREEVKFGPAAKKKGGTSLETTNFYLLHLSLMREYLDLEFHDIEPVLPFDYSLERVIDDFILLAVFVGNDFLPNLPDLHIHENGLERLFDVYKKVLPSLDGYINESGTINVKRLQVILDEMAQWEQDVFQKEYADLSWYKGKQLKHVQDMEMGKKRTKFVLTKPQREIFDKVRSFVMENRKGGVSSMNAILSMKNQFPARERAFITQLSQDLHLNVAWDEFDSDDENLVTWRFPGALEEPLPHGDGEKTTAANGDSEEPKDDDWESVEEGEDEDEESRAAVDRVLTKYEKAPVMDEDADGGFNARQERTMKEKMDEWKRGYYKGKLEISYDDPKEMGDLVHRYVEGLQWVMHYYYSGVASWGWFYDYHYAPRISDLRDVDKMTFHFDLGTPFKPFQQLMGVLPVASMEHIPEAYQDLMYDPNSPILDFYPLEFELDLNGKKQDWEAIVKIPFIDEKRLLKAMDSREHRLTPEEKRRNSWGTSTKFSFRPGEATVYPSSLPGFFPPIYRCQCIMEPFHLPTLDGLHLVPGLCDGVFLDIAACALLGVHGVNVHGSESRNKSMVVHIENPHEGVKTEEIGREMIGKQGLVVAISDSLFKYEKMSVTPNAPPKVVSTPHAPQGLGHWKMKAERIEQVYSKRCGVITGDVDILLHVRPLKGLKRLETGAFVKDYDGPEKEVEQAVQMCLSEVASEDPRFLEREAPPLSEEFPEGSKIFFLGEHAYGVAAQVLTPGRYYPSFKATEVLGLSGRALSKITSSFMVLTSDKQKTNLGLSLKFEAKSLKVIDYSRKDGRYWEFSEKLLSFLENTRKIPRSFPILDRTGDAMAQASDVLSGPDPDSRVKEIKGWLKSKGVRDFEPVSLFCDQLGKATVGEIEKLANEITQTSPRYSSSGSSQTSHAVYRLQNQHFALGDRVTMVQDSGGVPLSVKGVVVGLNAKTMDVIWDVPFMSGSTLGDRCSQYRGSTVEFTTCLNLTNPQFVTSTNPEVPPQPNTNPSFKPSSPAAPVHIMTNPNRGRGGFRGGAPAQPPVQNNVDPTPAPTSPAASHQNGAQVPGGGGRGYRGRGFIPGFRGGRGIAPNFDRGRGAPRGGFRGRGRGSFTAPLSS
ncbi:XRN 5'-3' exonuclease N-terminus-domain-containing protein [Cyathus striatus]|nr:XRN 5'-3' exonuclease N-terminus-domain-containing protein [Cyathus striatus]